MSASYERALKLWGVLKLNERYPFKTYGYEYVADSVKVEIDFDEGYSCCNGTDPDCYCSLAESPSANVKISANLAGEKAGRFASMTIPSYAFDFVTMLKELVDAADGEVTKEKGVQD